MSTKSVDQLVTYPPVKLTNRERKLNHEWNGKHKDALGNPINEGDHVISFWNASRRGGMGFCKGQVTIFTDKSVGWKEKNRYISTYRSDVKYYHNNWFTSSSVIVMYRKDGTPVLDQDKLQQLFPESKLFSVDTQLSA